VLRLEPGHPEQVEQYRTVPDAVDMQFDAEHLWMLGSDGTAKIHNVTTGAVVEHVDVAEDAAKMAFDGEAIWVVTQEGELYRH
jgi:hypothetical protein